MKFSILTLFPEIFAGPFNYSIVKKALDKKLVEINLVNIRDFSTDKYRTVDDKPYGGGAGMIMKVDIIDRALENLKLQTRNSELRTKTVLLDPKGKLFTQKDAARLSKYDHLILICGHYEGVDQRVKKIADESISLGNYILTGGEIPAMVVIDAISRLIPGVIKKESSQIESFTNSHLEFPQYTRPPEYKGMKVPTVLLSGNHGKINRWRSKNQKVYSID